MAKKTENGRLVYADLLRVLATVAVVVLHLAGSRMADVAVPSPEWGVFNLYDGLVRWCVPVFVMLSGMFMLDPDRPLPLSKLLLHNALRVLVCLFVYGTFYAWLDAGRVLSGQAVWRAFLSVLRGEAHYHLWFCHMILGLYLVTPILRAFCKGASRGDFHWFFLVAFLFASLLPLCFKVWPNATAVARTWYNRLGIQLILGYVGYYVAGYYLKAYTLSRLAEALIYVLGIVGAVTTVWGTALFSRWSGGLIDYFYDYASPSVACSSVAVVVLFRYVLGVSDERSRRQRMSGVAKISFGIYLIHDVFIMLLRHFGITTLSFAPVVSVPLLSAGVFLCAFAVAWLISKIPFIGRWLT